MTLLKSILWLVGRNADEPRLSRPWYCRGGDGECAEDDKSSLFPYVFVVETDLNLETIFKVNVNSQFSQTKGW